MQRSEKKKKLSTRPQQRESLSFFFRLLSSLQLLRLPVRRASSFSRARTPQTVLVLPERRARERRRRRARARGASKKKWRRFILFKKRALGREWSSLEFAETSIPSSQTQTQPPAPKPAMSSYKALFVVVLAAACSEVRVGRECAAMEAPARGGWGKKDVDFFSPFLSRSLFFRRFGPRRANLDAFRPRSFQALSNTPGPLSHHWSREEASFLFPRWGLSPMLHRAVARERRKRAFCRCFFFEKRGSSREQRRRLKISSPPPLFPFPLNTQALAQNGLNVAQIVAAKNASLNALLARKNGSVAFMRKCVFFREAHLFFNGFSSSSSMSTTMHSPSSSSRLFFFSLRSRPLSLSNQLTPTGTPRSTCRT